MLTTPEDRQRADRVAAARIVAHMMHDPEFWPDMARRWIVDQLRDQLVTPWLDRAEASDRAGDVVSAARCRIHAHLLADGDATAAEVEGDRRLLQACSDAAGGSAPMRDELDALTAQLCTDSDAHHLGQEVAA